MTPPLPPDSRDPFATLVQELEGFAWRPEVQITPMPAPRRIAAESIAIAADVVDGGQEVGNGRLVVLHDGAGDESWQGTVRMVGYCRSDVDADMASDSLLATVAWSWFDEALDRHLASRVAQSGTVTAITSQGFGGLQDEPLRAEVEIRASWTPVLRDGQGLSVHLAAWQELLCRTAGLPELPEGVVLLGSRMGRGR